MVKLTLAFTVYNKAGWMEQLVASWLDTLSGLVKVEVIAVFDACVDESEAIVHRLMKKHYPHLPYTPLQADDVHEIACNNLALNHAKGEYIVQIQDDNWMHDRHWDTVLMEAFQSVERPGMVGLLAGVIFAAERRRTRIECNRPHKGEHFEQHVLKNIYDIAAYEVDCAIRPFAAETAFLSGQGGLGKGFQNVSWDDMEMSLQAIALGRTNLYVPFDVINIGTAHLTFDRDTWRRGFGYNQMLTMKQHGTMIDQRIKTRNGTADPPVIRPMFETSEGVSFA